MADIITCFDFITTRSGHIFKLSNPQPYYGMIYDIAWSLSMQCRFCGHTKYFYSVAEHCYRMSLEVPKAYALAALLHDASEAFISDIPKPVKELSQEIKELEDNISRMIMEHFNISHIDYDLLHSWDLKMFATELRDLLDFDGQISYQAIDNYIIEPVSQQRSMRDYLDRFFELRR